MHSHHYLLSIFVNHGGHTTVLHQKIPTHTRIWEKCYANKKENLPVLMAQAFIAICYLSAQYVPSVSGLHQPRRNSSVVQTWSQGLDVGDRGRDGKAARCFLWSATKCLACIWWLECPVMSSASLPGSSSDEVAPSQWRVSTGRASDQHTSDIHELDDHHLPPSTGLRQ